LAADELVEEIQVPRPKQGSKSGYLKFRIRNSIDFPIASVATHFDMEGNAIRDARVVLGAVAPFPVRLREVEEFLKGKKVTETLAQEAADLAITETLPLSKNGYKVQITKALVRRAILSTGA
jgi:CO/xanthine dehydrogenase FAD-binding subunit